VKFVVKNLLFIATRKTPLDFALGTACFNGEVLSSRVKKILTIKVKLSNIACNVISKLKFLSIRLTVKSFVLGNAMENGGAYMSEDNAPNPS